MRNKVRKRVRAKHIQKARRTLEDQKLIEFWEQMADEARQAKHLNSSRKD